MNFFGKCFEELKVQIESGLRDEMLERGEEAGAKDFQART